MQLYALSEQDVQNEVQETLSWINEGVLRTIRDKVKNAKSQVEVLMSRVNGCRDQIRNEKQFEVQNRNLYLCSLVF